MGMETKCLVLKVMGADFERYSADFDADKGTGTVEIWLPVGEKG